MKVTKYANDVKFVEYFGEKRWSFTNNVLGSADDTSTAITLTANSKEVPAGLYLSEFDLGIPYNCRATKITVEVKLSSTGQAKSIEPKMSFYWGTSYNHWAAAGVKSESMSVNSIQLKTNGDTYPRAETIISKKITTSIGTKKLTPEQINKENFGVILQFEGATGKDKTILRVHWVRITAEYELDSYSLSFKGSGWTTEELAYENSTLSLNKSFTTTISCVNSSSSSNNNHVINVDIPVWLNVESFSTTNSTFRKDTGKWYCTAGVTSTLTLTMTARTLGSKMIHCEGAYAGKRDIFYDIKFGDKVFSDYLFVTTSDLRKSSKGYLVIDWYFHHDDEFISLALFDENVSTPFPLDYFEIDYANSDDGISFHNNINHGSVLELDIPADKDCHARVYVHFRPHYEGNRTLIVEDETATQQFSEFEYFVAEPYEYIFELVTKDMVISRKRIVSQVDSNALILPCRTSPYDENTIVKKPTLRAKLSKPIDYIGPIALEQTHYNPKSNYSDTLLNTSYKNKKYMGKEGASDETITLNIRLSPHDVTTVQGLVDMDKPVPLNTNHKCFEGDSLNHRGWAELYAIKNVTKTNPHWYDADISVSYITHNINTRFQIIKGNMISDYFLPNLLKSTMSSGYDIGDYFNVSTTGHYIYSDDETDFSRKNMFTIDEGEFVSIRSKDTLSIKSKVTFDWDSTKVAENKDNNVKRVIRLIDSRTNNAVLEYEYYDTDFSEDYRYKSSVICRAMHNGAYRTVMNRSMYLHSDVEYEGTEDDIDIYGSIVTFDIMGNKVSITDEGWSGKDIYIENIEIDDGEYYFEVEFTNKNKDIDIPPIVNFFDVELQELALTSEYANYYQKMIVSPFAVPNKKIVFTRDSEEGTIYYLYDDGEEFSFLLEPYYQYHCGVDLRSKDDISLMNLNNSYSSIYISNCLVKLSINRLNGHMKLYKYDRVTETYVYVRSLYLSKFKDINLNYYSDDKVVLQASDTIITMWRGRPFISFRHPTEDIYIKELTTKVFAESVGKYTSEFPRDWSLIQEFNLFPTCVGSIKLLDEECISLSSEQYSDSLEDPVITIDAPSQVGLGRTATIRFNTTTNNNCHAFIFVDGEMYSDDTIFRDGQITIEEKFDVLGEHTVRIITGMCNNRYNMYISEEVIISVEDISYAIKAIVPSKMLYAQKDFQCLLTYQGQPLANEYISFGVSGPYDRVSYPSQKTNSKGIATLPNSLYPNDYLIEMEYNYTFNNQQETISTSARTSIGKGDVSISIPHTWIKRYSYFTFKLTDNLSSSNNVVENTVAFVKINSKAYPVKTDEDGVGKLKIGLLKGNYKLSVVFGGNAIYNPKTRNTEIKVG